MTENHFHRQPRILIVDEDEETLFLIREILLPLKAFVQTCSDPFAIPELFNETRFDLAILDIVMPKKDGLEICKWIKSDAMFSDCSVIFTTSLSPEDKIDEAFKVGAFDYINKPINKRELFARVRSALKLKASLDEVYKSHAELQGTLFKLRNKHQVAQRALGDLKEVQKVVLLSLSKLAESRDNETGQHLLRTQNFVGAIAQNLREKPEYRKYIHDGYIEDLVLSAPLHDIGKVATPDRILHKTSSLSVDEFEIMKQHAVIGAETLMEASQQVKGQTFLDLAIVIAHYHHETNDGNGYPEGLKGEEIPLSARIMSVADIYDALRSRRCYKEPIGHEKAVKMILEDNGTRVFHPHILEAFVACQEQFREISEEIKDEVSDFNSFI